MQYYTLATSLGLTRQEAEQHLGSLCRALLPMPDIGPSGIPDIAAEMLETAYAAILHSDLNYFHLLKIANHAPDRFKSACERFNDNGDIMRIFLMMNGLPVPAVRRKKKLKHYNTKLVDLIAYLQKLEAEGIEEVRVPVSNTDKFTQVGVYVEELTAEQQSKNNIKASKIAIIV